VIRSNAEVTAAYLGADVNKTSTTSMELGDA
jgi:hypothetical protein